MSVAETGRAFWHRQSHDRHVPRRHMALEHTLSPPLSHSLPTPMSTGVWERRVCQMKLQSTSEKNKSEKQQLIRLRRKTIVCAAGWVRNSVRTTHRMHLPSPNYTISNWFGVSFFLLFHFTVVVVVRRYGISISWLSTVGLREDLKTVPHFILLQMRCISFGCPL